MAANSKVSDGIFLKFILIKIFKFGIIVNCKNEEDSPKSEGTRVVTTFFPIKVNGDFSRRSRAANFPVQGPIWPNFEPIRGFVGVLVAGKKKKSQADMKALEWSQHNSLVFQTLKGS